MTTSTEQNKAVVARAYETINQHDLDAFGDIVSEDCIDHEDLPGMPSRGPEAPKAAFGMFYAAFPDLRMTPEDTIAEGDKVVVRATMSGTHQGEFMGAPPTNKAFEVGVIDVFEVRDGMVTQHWGMTDQGAMMEQLGLAPEM